MNRFTVAAIVTSFFLLTYIAKAQVPQILNYQGRFVVNGTNFDGTGEFKFALVDGAGAGTYWSNGNDAVSLPVAAGLYSVLLGDTTLANMAAIPVTVFTNADVRLRVWFDGGAGLEQMTPDRRLAAVGYAMNAAQAQTAVNILPTSDVTGQRLNVGVGNTLNGAYATIAGGRGNSANDDGDAVGGGQNNSAADYNATVSGGADNSASQRGAAVGGGEVNDASATYATIGGGYGNAASTDYATVPGGYRNTAGGEFSFAAGQRAKALHDGAFVWGDSTTGDFISTANDQFLIRASGGVGIGTNDTSGAQLTVNGAIKASDFVGNGSGLSGVIPANGSVDSTKLAPGAVTATAIANYAITGANIASNTITAANMAPGIGVVPSGALVLSQTATNDVLTAAGYAPLITTSTVIYNGGSNWTQVAAAATWSGRYGFGAVVFNGQMWVLGGHDGINRNDVWSSTNGVDWTQVTAAAPWSGREGHAAVVLNGQMWVLGGLDSIRRNDVWSSTNGVDWTQVTAAAPWNARWHHAAVAYNGQLWVMGGADDNPYNDVWSSSDGTNWTQVTAAAPWSSRDQFSAVEFNGRIWVMGGSHFGALNDVWSSTDGTNWTRATAAAQWSARVSFGAVAFGGRMWVFGGDGSNPNDVWAATDVMTSLTSTLSVTLAQYYLFQKQ